MLDKVEIQNIKNAQDIEKLNNEIDQIWKMLRIVDYDAYIRLKAVWTGAVLGGNRRSGIRRSGLARAIRDLGR